MKGNLQRGFTLIELMIVVAIIAILAAVAIPMYSDYTQRATAATGIAALSSFKTSVALCHQRSGSLTGCTSGTNGIPAAIADADAVNGLDAAAATDGVITATLDAMDAADTPANITVTLTPTVTGSNLNWVISCSDYDADGSSRVDGCSASNAAPAAPPAE
jgi:prepilin-type N-terminal cleavage/methylation domain-containing protein